jgi:hypothetical protein
MDDKRVTVDRELRERVLDLIAAKHDIPMLDLVYMFSAYALARDLPPMPPRRKEVLSGDVFEELLIYRLVREELKTNEPRRVAHELANAGMSQVLQRLHDEAELVDVFELRGA